MNIPEDLKYSSDHEWVRIDGAVAVVGITEFAQAQLGDVVFVELPRVGKSVSAKGQICVVESTKAASEVFSPLAGTIAEANVALSSAPELINKSPYQDGWIAKIASPDLQGLAGLLDAQAYRKLIGG